MAAMEHKRLLPSYRLLTDCMRDDHGNVRDDMTFAAYWDGEKILFSKEFPPSGYLIEVTMDELEA